MKTTIDLPRPLLIRAASNAARKRIPLSRYIAESLERQFHESPVKDRRPASDPFFDELRQELGL